MRRNSLRFSAFEFSDMTPVLWVPVFTSSSRPKRDGVDQLDRFELLQPPKYWPALDS